MKSFIGLSLLAVSTQIATAGCDTKGLDKTLPRAISAHIDTGDFNFVWASDLDRIDQTDWITNYIDNQHTIRSLNVTWKKAGIHFPYIKPLAPLTAYCNTYPVRVINDDDIDDDAPILYGSSNNVQKAALYAKVDVKDASDSAYTSEIRTSYIDSSGEIRPIDVYFFYTIESKHVVDVGVSLMEQYFLSIPNITEIWSPEMIKSFSAFAVEQKTEAVITSPYKFSDSEETQVAYKALEYVDREALIVKGTVKAFGINVPLSAEKRVPVIIFDKDRIPVASGLITVPVTLQ